MLNLLTKYLLQYRRVSIPSVGTITLVQQPAQLNMVDKFMLPPSYRVEVGPEENISDHQLHFLSAALQEEKPNVLQRLNHLGQQLKDRIKSGGFYWQGVGLIRDGQEPVPLSLPALDPVPAERVLRQDAEHSVLVGDQQLTSTQAAGLQEEVDAAVVRKRSVFVIIGWILLLLAILYIVFVIYKGKFRVGSTGSRQAPTSSIYFQQKDFRMLHFPIIQ